jgi:hypothetical protein
MRVTGWIAAIVAVIILVVAFVYSRRPTIAPKPPAALAQRQEQRPHYL